MNKTKIEWCDYTWNPISGCSPASEGCDNCYAAAIDRRFKHPWGKPVWHPKRLFQPQKVKTGSRVFVCSMSDIFHEGASPKWIADIFFVIRNTPQHTFIMLTKRPERARRHYSMFFRELRNVWLGVTTENQARYDERVPILLDIPAAVRFVSIEPMLSHVNLRLGMLPKHREIDWIIAGPETGPGARACDDNWIADLADQCAIENRPFFDKRATFIRRQYPKGGAA